jgi:hypothetical protein
MPEEGCKWAIEILAWVPATVLDADASSTSDWGAEREILRELNTCMRPDIKCFRVVGFRAKFGLLGRHVSWTRTEIEALV